MSEATRVHPRAAVLTIGTEITTGQILNSNAQWFGEQLTNLGFDVVIHEVVPDDWRLISSALDRCAAQADLLIVGGGLGPTSDDFTRDVVGEWLGVSMSYHEPSWSWLSERIGRIGVEVAESNRRQCYYPTGANVIRNHAGTANAFWCEGRSKKIVCLPGPPREVRAVWSDVEKDVLRRSFILPEPERLIRWQCLGKSEAALGQIIEGAIAGQNVRAGYRPHVPFVEIKLWFPLIGNHDELIRKVDEALKPWCVGKDDIDAWREIFNANVKEGHRIRILDGTGTGELTHRILSLRNGGKIKFSSLSASFSSANREISNDESDWEVSIGELSGQFWSASIAKRGVVLAEVEVEFPYKYDESQRDRFAKFRTELSGFRLLDALRARGKR